MSWNTNMYIYPTCTIVSEFYNEDEEEQEQENFLISDKDVFVEVIPGNKKNAK